MMMCSRSFFILPVTIIIISCAIMAPHLQTASANPKKVVRILDSIPTNNPVQPMKPLLVHCKSKDTDLGAWAMNENDEREFHFRVNIWGTTLFWCEFNWGVKARDVVVFNAQEGQCGGERYCNWIVKTDGFYFAKGESPKDSDFVRQLGWADLILD
ncbi:hypothetical protein DM860_005639 [Cuscuta australis]|uniref:S-protein homolog n=1 Tax=Cuscuta australis TaxID=267555 RepID=A0A328DRA5_9ASTE|nr:hypothetical protein DM860_005639 [Cuscuta australis]